MATASLNDVTNALMILNESQGKTTDAVNTLVARFTDMVNMQKRNVLDEAERRREASNKAKTESTKSTPEKAPVKSFGVGDMALAGIGLGIMGFNQQIRDFIDGVQGNLLKFVNDVQKILFVLNQGLIQLTTFIDKLVISRIKNLILDFRTNPKTVKMADTIRDSIEAMRKVLDEAVKFAAKTLRIIGSAFAFTASLLRPVVAIFTAGVSEVAVLMTKLGGVFNFFKGIAKIFGKLFLPLTVFITAWDTIKGFVDGFKEEGLVGGLEGAVVGFFNSLIFAPLDLIKKASEWVLDQVGLTNVSDALSKFSFQDTFEQIVGKIFDGVQGAIVFVKDIFTFPEDGGPLAVLGKFIDIITLPINAAVNFVKGLFGYGDPEIPFKMSEFLGSMVKNIFGKIQNAFDSFVQDFIIAFKIAAAVIITDLQNIPDQLLKFLSDNVRFDIPKIAIPLPGILGGGEIVIAEGQSIGVPGREGAARRILERNAARDAKLLELGRQALEARSGGSNAVVIDNSQSSNSSSTQVIGANAPIAFDTGYQTFNPVTGPIQ